MQHNRTIGMEEIDVGWKGRAGGWSGVTNVLIAESKKTVCGGGQKGSFETSHIKSKPILMKKGNSTVVIQKHSPLESQGGCLPPLLL